MNPRKRLCVAVLSMGLMAASLAAVAASGAKPKQAKDYQVTGPILAVDGNLVTVQKDDEKWELELGADTKGATKLAVGDKVTIHYRMVASKVEKKDAKDAPKKSK